MAKKLNKIFRKSYTEKKFRRKILGKIYLADDRNLVMGAYEKQEGKYVPKEIDDKEKIKQLNAVAAHMKKNSGALGIGKLGTVAVLAILVIIFTVFFKNMLAEKGLEKGLEAVFRGQADVTGLRVSLFGGYLRYNSLEVADRNNLDRNLFQTGRGVIDLNMYEILKGKFAAEEIALEDLAFGMKRKTRALSVGGGDPEEKASDSRGEAGGAGLKLPENLVPDRAAVKDAIDSNLEKLTAPAKAEEIASSLTKGAEKINRDISKIDADIEKLKIDVRQISSTTLTPPIDLEEVRMIYDSIKNATESANSISSGINSSKREAENLGKIAGESGKIIEKAVSDDIDFIISLFPKPDSFSLSSLAESAVREKLSPFMEKYSIAFEIMERVTESSGSEKKTKPARDKSRGRLLHYPVSGTPSLHIEKVSGSFFTGSDRHSIKISDITNNQKLLGKPMLFSLESAVSGIETKAKGIFDTRDSAKDFSRVEISVTGGKISSAQFLSAAGIKSFSSPVNLELETAVSPGKIFSGKAGAFFLKPELEAVTGTGRIIKNIVSKEDDLKLEIEYAMSGGRLSLKMISPLDSLVAKAVSPDRIAAEVRGFASEEIMQLLKEKTYLVSEAEKKTASLKSEISKYENELREQRKSLEAKQKALPRL